MDYAFLRSFLKKNKITRQQFADDIGVTIGTVNTWLFKKPKKFSDDIAIKISEVYHIPLERLIGMKLLSQDEAMAWLAETDADVKEQEIDLISYFRKLNYDGREKAIDAVEMITKIPEYRKDNDTPEATDDE